MVPHRLRHRRRDRANQQTNHAHPPTTPQTVTRNSHRPTTPPYPPATPSTTNPAPATHLMSPLQRRNRQRRRETARPGGDRQVLPCTCPQAVLHHPKRSPGPPSSNVLLATANTRTRLNSTRLPRIQRDRTAPSERVCEHLRPDALKSVTASGARCFWHRWNG